MEESVDYHHRSEDEDDQSERSGDEIDRAFDDIPTLSSRSDTDRGLSS